MTISDSVVEIMSNAFCECTKLEKVIIPGSVTFIGWGALNTVCNTTIYAPAGSYAETYAKENNIPFVAD